MTSGNNDQQNNPYIGLWAREYYRLEMIQVKVDKASLFEGLILAGIDERSRHSSPIETVGIGWGLVNWGCMGDRQSVVHWNGGQESFVLSLNRQYPA
jgi:hypothetical protein